jgi:hypothetical protein
MSLRDTITAKEIDGDSLVPTLLTGADPGRPILQQMFFSEFIARRKPPLERVAVRAGFRWADPQPK